MNNLIVNINEYDSELQEFATLFHQDFDEIPDFSNEMILDYIERLSSNNKRKKNLNIELDLFLRKIKLLDKSKRLDLWFKLGAHYWNTKLDMYNELKKFKKILNRANK